MITLNTDVRLSLKAIIKLSHTSSVFGAERLVTDDDNNTLSQMSNISISTKQPSGEALHSNLFLAEEAC